VGLGWGTPVADDGFHGGTMGKQSQDFLRILGFG